MLRLWLIVLVIMSIFVYGQQRKDYELPENVESRSISFENITGEKGQGAKAANSLGVGRKGSAYRWIEPGETVEIFNVDGAGIIHHIWCTPEIAMNVDADREILLGLVIRAYWEHQEHPSIEAPLGNFFGIANGRVVAYESAIHSVNPKAGMNIWAKMPFAKHGRITITNETTRRSRFFYNINYTINEELPKNFGRLHCLYRRENPTILKKDFEILPFRESKGRYLGCLLGIRLLDTYWWGEGEFKAYLDGDKEFPTIVGTGLEDYVGHSYGIQDTTYRFGGCPFNKYGLVSLYRWHIEDPLYWHKDIRITVQQIGNRKGYYERSDDYNVTTFWYESCPSAELAAFASFEQRIADYESELINIDGAIEFEDMRGAKSSTGRFAVVPTDRYWGRWSGNKQLLWRAAELGAVASFEFNVGDGGEYVISGNFMKSRHSPKLSFTIDGKELSKTIDNYDWTHRPTFKLKLGDATLEKGRHRFEVKVAGAHEEALTPYEVGMDYILLERK
jgi:hypothetical protein